MNMECAIRNFILIESVKIITSAFKMKSYAFPMHIERDFIQRGIQPPLNVSSVINILLEVDEI